MVILYKPGEEQFFHLPSEMDLPEEDRAVVGMRVLTEAEYQKILRMKTGSDDPTVPLRTTFGAHITRIEKLKFADGSEFEVRKTPDGLLTRECFAELRPLVPDLDQILDRVGRVNELERKNSNAPSR